MADSTRIENLRLYLIGIIQELNDKFTLDKQINIDFLDDKANNYSINKIPTNEKTENWVIGTALVREIYSFRARMNYSEDTIVNLANIGFFESFEQVIKNKNNDRNFPDIKGIQRIACATPGTMLNAGTNTAIFEIQILIEYLD